MKSLVCVVAAALSLVACVKKTEETVVPKVDVITKQDAENVAMPLDKK